jgi:hypothetical protein
MMIKMPSFFSTRSTAAVTPSVRVTDSGVRPWREGARWESAGNGGRRPKLTDGRCEDAPDDKRRLDDATSFTQTQQDYLVRVKAALGRMEELALRAAQSGRTSTDLAAYNAEYGLLSGYIREVAARKYNGAALFDGQSQSIPARGEPTMLETVAVDLEAAPYAKATRTEAFSTVEAAQAAAQDVGKALAQFEDDWKAITEGLNRFKSLADKLWELRRSSEPAEERTTDCKPDSDLLEVTEALQTTGGRALSAQANAIPQMVMRLT